MLRHYERSGRTRTRSDVPVILQEFTSYKTEHVLFRFVYK